MALAVGDQDPSRRAGGAGVAGEGEAMLGASM